jgi:hypothetical protein
LATKLLNKIMELRWFRLRMWSDNYDHFLLQTFIDLSLVSNGEINFVGEV